MVRWVIRSIPHGGPIELFLVPGNNRARCSPVIRAFAQGAILHGGPIELFLVPANNRARCSPVIRAFAHGAMGHQIYPSWWTH